MTAIPSYGFMVLQEDIVNLMHFESISFTHYKYVPRIPGLK